MRILLVPWYCPAGFRTRVYKSKGDGEINGFLEHPRPMEFRTLVGHRVAITFLNKYGTRKKIAVFNSGRYFRVAVELNLSDEFIDLLKKLSENEGLMNKRKKRVEKLLEKITAKRLRTFLSIEKLVGRDR